MDTDNRTRPADFVLLRLPGPQAFPLALFALFLGMYMLTVGGNVAILVPVVLVSCCRQLHTPMYFFLSNLSFLEIWYTTAAVPKALAILLGGSWTLAYASCLAQMYLVFSLGCTEYFLLAAMAYDRYLAVCWPLRYHAVMSGPLSAQLALGSWLGGFLAIAAPTPLVGRLSLCGPVVLIWFRSTIFLHMGTSIQDALDLTKAVHVLNTVVTPVLNPFIYTLLNKEVREALRKNWAETSSREQTLCKEPCVRGPE
ncbi:LOW QUALITY PROTEIN: olfactory receptor 287-like [Tupaia chinensis]|uniref:LOW QUALITY PROTEIN: olfactory receptor 287-like n=1 Tax=Tupaia chinensis TaxID=246437 RepID=UPI000703D983|nr:LOW QUALITY PROTEIN: olfactory receptor 287-like [Tupaia chinensis]